MKPKGRATLDITVLYAKCRNELRLAISNIMFSGTSGIIRLLVSKQSSAGKRHMCYQMFMFDRSRLRVDCDSLSAPRPACAQMLFCFTLWFIYVQD